MRFAAAAMLVVGAAPLNAAERCRDTKGHFTKCPIKNDTKAQRCKDAKGKFARCGIPGSKPI